MMGNNCLNCGDHVATKFCGNCGQTTSTHRYSLMHFIEHDFIHGVWHVDKGILFTIKQLFTRPGHSVRAFVQGKRSGLFNFVTLILLILAASSVIGQYTHFKMSDMMPEASKKTMNVVETFSAKYPKLVLLITIPITSFLSFIWFRKAKFNYSEHLVLNSYKTSVELLAGLLFTTLTIFYTNTQGLLLIYYLGIQTFSLVYSIWFYYQFFSTSGYSKKALAIRSVMTYFSLFLISFVIGIVFAIIDKLHH